MQIDQGNDQSVGGGAGEQSAPGQPRPVSVGRGEGTVIRVWWRQAEAEG